MEVQDLQREVAILKSQLRDTRQLLKSSMRSNNSFNEQERLKITKTLENLTLHEQNYSSLIANPSHKTKQTLLEQKLKASELQCQEYAKLVERLESFNEKLQGKVKEMEQQSLDKQIKIDQISGVINELQQKLKSKEEIQQSQQTESGKKCDQLQKQIDQQNEQMEKLKQERDVSKDQNKKLVELLNKLEKKLNDKALREEQLEEECLHLKESLQLMTVQVEKIEHGLEKKVKEKDHQVKKLLKQVDMLEREKRMKEDMDELINETQVLQEKNNSLLNESKDLNKSQSMKKKR